MTRVLCQVCGRSVAGKPSKPGDPAGTLRAYAHGFRAGATAVDPRPVDRCAGTDQPQPVSTRAQRLARWRT
jgi:hypothetical protein